MVGLGAPVARGRAMSSKRHRHLRKVERRRESTAAYKPVRYVTTFSGFGSGSDDLRSDERFLRAVGIMKPGQRLLGWFDGVPFVDEGSP